MPTPLRRQLDLIIQVGLALNRGADLEGIVQTAVDAARDLCGAQFGAFFYNVTDSNGERLRLFILSGARRSDFDKFPQPRNTQVFGPTFEGRETLRSGDITKDPRYGHNAPIYGMPEGHLPVKSYLAVPVKTQLGEVLGGMFFGHAQPNIFDQESEDLVAAVAAQAAIAIENSRLREDLTRKVQDLQRANARQREASRDLSERAAIIEYSEDAIITKDPNGIVTSWNPAAARILGYSADEMIGQSILKIIPPELHGDEPIILDNIRRGKRIEHFETVRIGKGGRRLDVSLTISPIRDDSGAIVGASKILRDVTERKRMEALLLQSEKIAVTGRMAATIAHEINNPLEAVVNLLFLARIKATDPEQQSYLTAAENEIERLSHIARQTLGYYREHTVVASASLSALVAEALRIYHPRLEGAGIHVQTRYESSRRITLRKGEIMQVISNLIVNSIQAMSTGGDLTVTVKDESFDYCGPHSMVVCVADTGPGIPPEVLPRVFDAFFTTGQTVGTGIGLFVAKQFVEGHGGTIKIETSTDAAQHGTRVYVILPLDGTYAQAARS